MKKILTFIFFLLLMHGVQAQLVINEVFYNSPDGSPDLLEFIEIYNADFFDVNLGSYQMTEGIVYDFPDVILPAGAYYVLTNDSITLDTFFGVVGHEWSPAENLSNGGESLVLKDTSGNTIDSLTYDNNEPWPEPASGNGYSMELCGVHSDNALPSNWFKSDNPTGMFINNVELRCTPGAANSVCSPFVHQLLITEIFYNPPGGSGSDSLEFIELYNASDESIPLQGMKITEGFQFVFPDEELDPGDYLLIGNNPDAIRNTFFVPNSVNIWTYDSGELSNSEEEDIVLLDGNDLLVDEVHYDVSWPYHPAADGDGYSLELCDYTTDNSLALNWKISASFVGFEISNKTIFCTPGADNSPCPEADHIVVVGDDLTFTPENLTIFQGETVEWRLASTSVHNINGLQTIFNNPPNAESFYSGEPVVGPWRFSHTFTNVGHNNYRCDEHYQQGMTGTVFVEDPPYDDIVITEILYHQPGGDNNYDFVEFYNRSNEIIDLDDYFFDDGVEFNFPNIAVDPGEYLVVTKDAEAFYDAFGINAFEWELGGLNNNGETISLSNGVSLVDFVDFQDNAPWPEIADGEGAAMMLCDPESDNSNPFNWRFSTTQTSVATVSNPNLYIHATPGMPNDTCPLLPTIFFGEDIPVSVPESIDSFIVKFKMANVFNTGDAFVDIIVESSSTATLGIDFSLEETTIDFHSGEFGETTLGRLKIYVEDDLIPEPTETIVIRLTNPVNATLATIGTATIKIEDNDGFDPNLYPEYEIGDVTTVGDGDITDSLDVVCALRGIVYGYNIHPEGVEFTLIDKDDKEDGIRVFKFSDAPDYEVQEGDEVSVYGIIQQFNGLTQIIPDTIILQSQDNALFDADTIVVGALSEEEESKLIAIKGCVEITDVQNVGPARHYFVQAQNTGEIYLMRVDDDTDVPPTTDLPVAFHLTGIGSQIDPTEPYNSGYMIMPRYAQDIDATGCVVSTSTPEDLLKVLLYPNPSNQWLNIESELALEQIIVHNMLGQRIIDKSVESSHNVLNIRGLAPGGYLITLIHQGKTRTLRFVKN